MKIFKCKNKKRKFNYKKQRHKTPKRTERLGVFKFADCVSVVDMLEATPINEARFWYAVGSLMEVRDNEFTPSSRHGHHSNRNPR